MIKSFLHKLIDWLLGRGWNDCVHDWIPEGFADWKCGKCGCDR